MGSTALLRVTSSCCSSSSLRPLASPSCGASGDNKWTGKFNIAVVNRQFNIHTSFSANGSAFRLATVRGPSPQRQLRVTALFGKEKPTVAAKKTVIPDPDYRIGTVLLSAAGAFLYTDNLLAAVPIGLLGLLLLFQMFRSGYTDGKLSYCSRPLTHGGREMASRVRFVFTDEALEVKVGDELEDSGENVFVGGKNLWKFKDFVNWEFWWPSFPVLVYYKAREERKPEGQIHFFPVIFNGKQVYDLLVERAGPSKTSGPK